MGGATVPWLVLIAFITYQHGVKQGKLPEPHYYIGGTAAMSIAALVGMLNQTVGTLFAWALFIGVVTYEASRGKLIVPPKSETGPTSTADSGGGGGRGIVASGAPNPTAGAGGTIY